MGIAKYFNGKSCSVRAIQEESASIIRNHCPSESALAVSLADHNFWVTSMSRPRHWLRGNRNRPIKLPLVVSPMVAGTVPERLIEKGPKSTRRLLKGSSTAVKIPDAKCGALVSAPRSKKLNSLHLIAWLWVSEIYGNLRPICDSKRDFQTSAEPNPPSPARCSADDPSRTTPQALQCHRPARCEMSSHIRSDSSSLTGFL